MPPHSPIIASGPGYTLTEVVPRENAGLRYRLLDADTYTDLRYRLICEVERPALEPYIDSSGAKIIGLGFNLDNVDKRDVIIKAVYGADAERAATVIEPLLNQPYASTRILRDTLSAALSNNGLAPFAFASDEAARELFDGPKGIVHGFERGLDARLDKAGINMPPSYERLAMMSLYWNGPQLISKDLLKDISQGDRAEAWHRIRYETGKTQGLGFAKRRAFEAQVFGLYDDPENVGTEEALHVCAVRNKYQEKMDAYDNNFNGYWRNANRDYHTARLPEGFHVLSSDEAFLPAQSVVVKACDDAQERTSHMIAHTETLPQDPSGLLYGAVALTARLPDSVKHAIGDETARCDALIANLEQSLRAKQLQSQDI